MGTYPTTPRADFLLWCQAHAPIFSANAAAIGLTPAQATSFSTIISAAVNSNLASEQAGQAARAATGTNGDRFAALRGSAAEMVRSIRTYAENKNDPNVYVIAQIPPPAAGTPMPPPGQPTELAVGLDPTTGDIELRWKVVNPPGAAGTSYIVRRKLPEQTEWTFIGATGSKKFIDTTFLAGPDQVQYTVQGQRSDASGPLSPILTVNFGRQGQSFTISSVSGGSEVKLAA